VKVHAQLKPFYIGELDRSEHPTFPPMSEFYISLKAKVEKYFADRNLSPRYSPEMLFRCAFLVAFTLAMTYAALTVSSREVSFFCALLAGLGHALLCFMPVHEGSHAATTSSPWMWRLLGAVHDFVNGASFYVWIHQHFLGHHPFTNVTTHDHEGIKDALAVDPDVVTGDPDIRRIKPAQPHYAHYRFQQFYVPLAYGLLGIKSRLSDFSILFVTRMDGAIRVNPPTAWHLWTFALGKLTYVTWRLIVPCVLLGWQRTLFTWFVSDLALSYTLAFVFQVNHVIPQAIWPVVDPKTNSVNMDWAEMQLRTTMDYAHDSWWTTFLTGALNYQVTHHLFPHICQTYYPQIAPIVKEHCRQHKMPYLVLPTFWDALANHVNYLAVMGHEKH
jgi:fatty acid desaturase